MSFMLVWYLIGFLIIVGVLWWAVTQIPLPPPADWIVRVVFGVVVALVIAQFVFGGGLGIGAHCGRLVC